jgi:hypothetical protein
MARWQRAAGAALAMALALAVQGCAREDGSRILGHWRAERFAVMSLKLPVGPELHITRDRLASADNALALPISAITQDDDEVTLETAGAIGLSFHFVEPDRMYVELPFVGKIYYRRVADTPPEAVAQGSAPAAQASVPAPAAPAAPVRPVAETAPAAPAAAPGEQYYHQALASAREGDDDGALRHLHRAFGAGFSGAGRVAVSPEFAHLRTDVRFQVLLSRYNGE